jgi:hypothetical protein
MNNRFLVLLFTLASIAIVTILLANSMLSLHENLRRSASEQEVNILLAQYRINDRLTDVRRSLGDASSAGQISTDPSAQLLADINYYKSLLSDGRWSADAEKKVPLLEEQLLDLDQKLHALTDDVGQIARLNDSLSKIAVDCAQILSKAPTWATRQRTLQVLELLADFMQQSEIRAVDRAGVFHWQDFDQIKSGVSRFLERAIPLDNKNASSNSQCIADENSSALQAVIESINSAQEIRANILAGPSKSIEFEKKPLNDKFQSIKNDPFLWGPFVGLIVLIGTAFLTVFIYIHNEKKEKKERELNILDMRAQYASLYDMAVAIARDSRGKSALSWTAAKDLLKELELPETMTWLDNADAGVSAIHADVCVCMVDASQRLQVLNSDFMTGVDDARLERRIEELVESFDALARHLDALRQAISLQSEAGGSAKNDMQSAIVRWRTKLEQLTRSLLDDVQRLGREITRVDARKHDHYE